MLKAFREESFFEVCFWGGRVAKGSGMKKGGCVFLGKLFLKERDASCDLSGSAFF